MSSVVGLVLGRVHQVFEHIPAMPRELQPWEFPDSIKPFKNGSSPAPAPNFMMAELREAS